MDVELLETMLKNKQREKEVDRIVSFQSEAGVAKGENYTSQVLRMKLDIILGSGKKCQKSVIVKLLPSSQIHNQFVQEHGIFIFEIRVYIDVLEKMEDLMYEFKDVSDTLWCEFIGHYEGQSIILEDLREKQYFGVPRTLMLDMDHTIIAVTGLARFHVMSKVLWNRKVFKQDLFKNYLFLKDDVLKTLIAGVRLMSETMKSSWGPQWSERGEKLGKHVDDIKGILHRLAKLESQFPVLNHGDCWTNNLLFRTDRKTSKPVAVKFVDYQLTNYNGHAWDLTYFMYNSVQAEVRRERSNDILAAYMDTLQEYASLYELEESQLTTLNQLKKEMEQIKYFGYILLFTIHAITASDVSDNVDFEKLLDDESAGINPEVYTSKLYRKKIEPDVIYFVDNNFFQGEM